jgi:hypothetical protein
VRAAGYAVEDAAIPVPAVLSALRPQSLRDARRRLAFASWRVLVVSMGLLLALGLLAAFWQVARDAVRQGEARREATARRTAASWRCERLSGAPVRAACLRELDAHHR